MSSSAAARDDVGAHLREQAGGVRIGLPFANPSLDLLSAFLPSALHSETARLHDLTTSIETEVPRTSTHVFVVYKINTGFARMRDGETTAGLDTRFDVQVTQPLSLLDFTSAQWQLVFAVRNLFREAAPGASVYDELLVVRPPKRVVGGLVVRF